MTVKVAKRINNKEGLQFLDQGYIACNTLIIGAQANFEIEAQDTHSFVIM
jgi:hypothetical protein